MKSIIEQPYFSIIIPVYKVEKYIHQCVDSIINQRFDNMEIILVDDGSPDSCPEICDLYGKRDQRIKVIHKKNGGLSDARNFGLKAASGKYILFIDSDDYLGDCYLLQEAHDRLLCGDFDLLIYGYTKYYENAGKFKKSNLFEKSRILEGDIKTIIKNNLYVLSAWGKIIKTEILKRKGLKFTKGIFCEDMDWSIKIALNVDRVCVLNSEAYMYRQRKGSISNSTTEKNVNDIEKNIIVSEKIIKDVNRQELKNALEVYISQFISMYMIILSWLNMKEREKHLDFAKKAAPSLKKGIRLRERILYGMYKALGISLTLHILNLASKVIR